MAASAWRVQASPITNGYGSLSYSATLTGTTAGNTLLLVVSSWEASGDGLPNAFWLSGSGISGVSFTKDADSGPLSTGGADNERCAIYRCHGIPGGDVTVQTDWNGGTQVAVQLIEVAGLANAAPIGTGFNTGTSTTPAIASIYTATVDQPVPFALAAISATSATLDNFAPGQPTGWWSHGSVNTAASTHALHVESRVPPTPEVMSISWGTTQADSFWAAAVAVYAAEAGSSTLHLHNAQANGLGAHDSGALRMDLLPTYAQAAASMATPTTAGGTLIQMRSNAAGALREYITPPLAEALTLNGTITFRVRAFRSADVNAGIRLRLYQTDLDASNEVQIGTDADTAEIGTGSNWYTPTTTASSVTVGVGKRLLLRPYLIAAGGTMVAASPGITANYGGTTTAGFYVDLPQEAKFGHVASPALTVPAPTVAATTEAPATADAALTVPAPTVSATTSAGDATASAALTVPAPTISATGTAEAAASAALTVPAPTISATSAAGATASAALTAPAPAVTATTSAGDATASAALTVPAPTVAATVTEPGAETASAALTVPAPVVSASVSAGDATASAALTVPAPTVTASATEPGVESASAALVVPAPTISATVTAPYVEPPIAPTVGAWGAGTVQRIPRDGEGADRLPGPPQRRQAASIPPGTPLSGDRLGSDAQRIAMLSRLQQQGMLTEAMRAELQALVAVAEAIAREDDDMAVLLLAS